MPPRTPAVDRATLSRADIEMLSLLAEGLPLRSVARRLHLSERSVRRRVRQVCDRLGVRTSMQAIVWAARRGLV